MPLAPEISAFGDGDHETGETGLTIDGGGFGAFPGFVWIYQNEDRTGSTDQLIPGAWNDIQISMISIPSSVNNQAGTRYLFVQREDLAWSQGFGFTLSIGASEADTHDLASSNRVKRVKDRPRKAEEDNLPKILERAIVLTGMIDGVNGEISVAGNEAVKTPIRLLKGKQARVQVKQLASVANDVREQVNHLEIGQMASSQMQAIEGTVDRVIELSVNQSIANAAKSVKNLVSEVQKGLP
jgi:hypothetical protein